MGAPPPIPGEYWHAIPPDAQAALLAAFERLERRIAELEEKLNRNSTNSSKPPSTDPPSVKRKPPVPPSGKRRGGQPGHKRHLRELVPTEQVRETFDVKPENCRRCGHLLEGTDPEPRRHQVAELPPIQPVIDEYRLHRLRCPRCGVATRADLPEGVPSGAFGPRLRAVLSILAGAYRIGKRGIKQLASDLFGLSISLGMIAKLERQCATDLEGPVAELYKEVLSTPSAHIDETSWREGGKRAWLWAVTCVTATVFRIARSRGSDVAKGLLGEAPTPVVVSDRFPSYNWIETRQYCWAHLRRDFQAMIDRGGEAAEVGCRLLGHSDRLFRWWHRVRDGTMARSTLKGYTDPLRWGFRRDLQAGAACRCAKTAATCRELLESEENLWTFLQVEGVEPTNNAAERALRHAVLYRKTSGGTDSERGSKFVERVLSVVATCRQRGGDTLDYLTRCYQSCLEGRRPSPIPFAVAPTADEAA
jgi:transposase